eukprot:TRINITY_DN6115_c0_g2_i3.p1 TRINITY_DN6115_c0_g2~~TRINITY_DN6115_c0_g2_i3.p1  ORF type:complete len:644 (+),score=128.38 TRINITY_DN6115_c0_g2_i3:85-1932(+)
MVVHELQRLANMLRDGLLTDAEFRAAKRAVLQRECSGAQCAGAAGGGALTARRLQQTAHAGRHCAGGDSDDDPAPVAEWGPPTPPARPVPAHAQRQHHSWTDPDAVERKMRVRDAAEAGARAALEQWRLRPPTGCTRCPHRCAAALQQRKLQSEQCARPAARELPGPPPWKTRAPVQMPAAAQRRLRAEALAKRRRHATSGPTEAWVGALRRRALGGPGDERRPFRTAGTAPGGGFCADALGRAHADPAAPPAAAPAAAGGGGAPRPLPQTATATPAVITESPRAAADGAPLRTAAAATVPAVLVESPRPGGNATRRTVTVLEECGPPQQCPPGCAASPPRMVRGRELRTQAARPGTLCHERCGGTLHDHGAAGQRPRDRPTLCARGRRFIMDAAAEGDGPTGVGGWKRPAGRDKAGAPWLQSSGVVGAIRNSRAWQPPPPAPPVAVPQFQPREAPAQGPSRAPPPAAAAAAAAAAASGAAAELPPDSAIVRLNTSFSPPPGCRRVRVRIEGHGRLPPSEATAFDTKGDGRLDAFDTTGDGRVDSVVVPADEVCPWRAAQYGGARPNTLLTSRMGRDVLSDPYKAGGGLLGGVRPEFQQAPRFKKVEKDHGRILQ